MSPTPEQIRQALQNTLQQPRNQAPVIYQSIKNETPDVTSAEGFLCPIEVTDDDGQEDISIS